MRDEPLQPTAWRTCRALANHTRLAMLRLLYRQPDQTVTAVARQLQKPLSLVSTYLRTLEARGLLTVQRVGRRAVYRPSRTESPVSTSGLAVALNASLRQGNSSLDSVFRQLTAFTHPRRVELYRALQRKPLSARQLRAALHISEWALRRHLQKLIRRGFVTQRSKFYNVTPLQESLKLALVRLALQ